MYVTEKEMRDRLKLDSKGDLIGKLVMAYMTIRQLQEKLEGAKNTEQQVQPDNGGMIPGKCLTCTFSGLVNGPCCPPLQVN